MTVAGYCRVSTTEQAEHGYSIKEQEERVRAYCQAKGWILCRVYSDPGFSGATTDRPGLQAMLSDISAGGIDAVLVYKLDRLSRSQKDALHLIEDVFLASNIGFISISENFDTSTPLGRAMVGILAVFAQLEREQIKERMVLGKTARAKSGKWQGGNNTPVGYLLDKEKGLRIYEDEAEYVRLIFDMFTAGSSLDEIEREMAKIGAKSRYGIFTKINMNRLLGNPVYIGKLTYKGEVYDAAHDFIVTAQVFEKAQEIRGRNHKAWENKIRGSKNPSLLSGILFCGQCGGRYHHVTWKTGSRPRYVCYSRDKRLRNMIKDPGCKNKIWLESELDDLIISEIKKLSTDPDALRKATEPKKRKQRDNSSDLQKQLSRLRKQRSRYMDLYAIEDIDLASVRDKLTGLNQQISALENQLAEITAAEPPKPALNPFPVISAGEIIDFASKAEKRAIIRSLIKKVEIDGDSVKIYWLYI